MTRGAMTCADDHGYVPAAQSSARRMRVELPMKRTEPMGSQAQMYSLSFMRGKSLGRCGQ